MTSSFRRHIIAACIATCTAALCGTGTAQAQFAVHGAIPVPPTRSILPDTLRRLPPQAAMPEVDVFNRAKQLAEQRAVRHKTRRDRNTVEFIGKFELSQTQFDNWAPGGQNTFSGRSTLFFRHQHQRKKHGMDYRVESRYGMNRIDGKNFKNEDEFKTNFTTSWTIHKNWSYAGTTNLRSQFSDGFRSRTDKTLVSAFMAPAFFDVAVGFTYKKAPLSMILSPIGGSAIFVLNDELSQRGINGVPKGHGSRWQVGPSVKINFDRSFAKNAVRVRSEVYSFTNIKTAPTFRWETTVEIRATKFLTTTLYNNLNYNKLANTPRPDHIQHNYSIGMGLIYNFKNK